MYPRVYRVQQPPLGPYEYVPSYYTIYSRYGERCGARLGDGPTRYVGRETMAEWMRHFRTEGFAVQRVDAD